MSIAQDPVETFRIEANDLFEQLESALLDIEDNPHDKELIDTAFRALHTIKGSGAMFGFDRAAAFTHHVENAFDMVRKGTLAASPELVNIALSARDHIRALIIPMAPIRCAVRRFSMISPGWSAANRPHRLRPPPRRSRRRSGAPPIASISSWPSIL